MGIGLKGSELEPMGLGLRFQCKPSHTSEEEVVVVLLFKVLKFFGLLGPDHKIF